MILHFVFSRKMNYHMIVQNDNELFVTGTKSRKRDSAFFFVQNFGSGSCQNMFFSNYCKQTTIKKFKFKPDMN